MYTRQFGNDSAQIHPDNHTALRTANHSTHPCPSNQHRSVIMILWRTRSNSQFFRRGCRRGTIGGKTVPGPM